MTIRHALFEAWRGKYSDSPRALSEAIGAANPAAERIWIASNPHTFPDDVKCIPRHRVRHFASLWSCDLLITNDIVTKHLVKGRRVVYLQTWHGSPIKVVGLDETDPKYAGKSHLKRLQRDVKKWDYLLSASQAYTNIYRKAFGYEGEILEFGYPRNDILVNDDGTRRRNVRETLGITNDEIAVLYAPTWRDDAKNHDGSGFFHPRLVDWETLCGALPEQMVFLNRLHQHVTQYERPEVGERIKDVSSYEEMSDLILASDILVSDYSSLIYDYAVSGKPIILHAPDLRHYRDQLRSFYFEYEDWVPGPITSNTGELVEQLREVHEVQSVFRHKYNEFVKKFCTFDTGQASTQTVSRLLNDGVL